MRRKLCCWVVSLCLFALVTRPCTVKGANMAIYYPCLHSDPHFPVNYRWSRLSSRSRRSRFGSRQHVAVAAVTRQSQEAIPKRKKETSEVNYDELGPVGKVVAGVTQVAVTTLLEYCSGFFAGYFLGTVVGAPGFVFRPMQPGVPQMFLTEVRGRLGRMNARSMTWAKNWGGISAAFGGFNVFIKVVRNGKEDDWNQILSSAAAGAFFARNEGPQAMLKGAILYGGMIYFLSGGLGSNKPLYQFTEEPAEF